MIVPDKACALCDSKPLHSQSPALSLLRWSPSSSRAAQPTGTESKPCRQIGLSLVSGTARRVMDALPATRRQHCCLQGLSAAWIPCAWSRRVLPRSDLDVPCRSGKARAHLSNTGLILSAVGGAGLFFALAAMALWLDLALHSRHAAECAARQQVAGPAAPLATLVRAAATASFWSVHAQHCCRLPSEACCMGLPQAVSAGGCQQGSVQQPWHELPLPAWVPVLRLLHRTFMRDRGTRASC